MLNDRSAHDWEKAGGFMYKIREAAKLLKVETIEIHKKLISLRKELQGHVRKVNGITSIDQEGIDIISLSFSDPGPEEILLKEALPTGESVGEAASVGDREAPQNLEGEPGEEPGAIRESCDKVAPERPERDIASIKAEINQKKSELNMLNQRLIAELQRSTDYTKELNDLHQKLEPYFR